MSGQKARLVMFLSQRKARLLPVVASESIRKFGHTPRLIRFNSTASDILRNRHDLVITAFIQSSNVTKAHRIAP
jgi:hypothetical protein